MAELEPSGPAELAVKVDRDADGTTLVSLAGELDISNVAKLHDALDPLLDRRPQRLAFDLSELRFMDSSGIAVLLTSAARSESVEVRRPSEILRQVIEYMGLSEVLSVQP